MNFPENVPWLSIILSVSFSSISPVSESTTLSSNSCAIWQSPFDGVIGLTGSCAFKNSTVSLYGASPSWVLTWTFIPGIFIVLSVKYDIYSWTLSAYAAGLARSLFISSNISLACAVAIIF